MFIKERTLRVVGYLIVTAIFFIFFMLEMFFSWEGAFLFQKVFFITVLHTLFIWEPTRFCILWLRKRFGGLFNVKKRISLALLILVPYSFLIGFSRIYIEDITNIWNVPVAHITSYSYTIGISLLFILLQLAVYESLYFFEQWSKSLAETEELKRLNYQIQLDSIKVQIQPHFLFNNLNTLIGLIEADADRAISFTENLSFVYRYLLQANDKALTSVKDELQFTILYFSLLKTRYPDGLYLIHALNEMEQFAIPPLSLHLLIENAVKHNNFSSVRPLKIELEFSSEEQRLLVTNNRQPKTGIIGSGKGLAYLRKQFALLHLPDIKVKEQDNQFSVSIPLVNKYQYERINH